ncbi:MAG: cob(I)yrinic acid a,c-diamide adenosyltransferase [Candidatus Marinimicrobia bacterium]|nr:cob(I)yrinic acid a,c-diamide adenosyltransferase [Candidatus Neomarinimicrobiota bacterium]
MKEKTENGLVIIFTGNGKGKTTASLGTAFRSLGYGWNVCIVQFIKGDWNYGEMDAVKLVPNIELHQMGRGFCKIMGDNIPEEEHRKSAEFALEFATEKMNSNKYELMILDEVFVAISTGILSEKKVIEFIKQKPKEVNLILTGRDATKKIIEIADLVSEMKEIKHPYQKGILAKKGIDF